jgi:putative Mg2+ transporter-C (MgtC) family protein
MEWPHIVDLLHRERASGIVASSLAWLVLAAVLGSVIGLERELRHRPAGLRTNNFICSGAALFTILSDALAVEHPGDHTQVPAQVLPGIGFIGAGSILHTRGLTTASTLFVVASVGMATGSLYLTAVFTTGLVVAALFSLAHLELTFNLKTLLTSDEVTGASGEQSGLEVNRILEHRHRMMQNVLSGNTGQHVRLQFDVSGCNLDQKELRGLEASTVLGSVTSLGPVELG